MFDNISIPQDIINKHKTTIGEHESICNSQISLERLKYEIDTNATYLDGKLIKVISIILKSNFCICILLYFTLFILLYCLKTAIVLVNNQPLM